MVGGVVIEVITLPDRLWINTMNRKRLDDRCAIYVERNETSERIKPNDSLWWQGDHAFWTPHNRRVDSPFDIMIRRIGFSGISRESALKRHAELLSALPHTEEGKG
jgi:hypothetical protein